jgi:hypothetical protein
LADIVFHAELRADRMDMSGFGLGWKSVLNVTTLVSFGRVCGPLSAGFRVRIQR